MPSATALWSFARKHAWILPLLALALWLRLAGLGDEHLYGDEAEYAIVARYLSRDATYLAYPDITGMGAVPFVSQPPLVLYLMAGSMAIFGPSDLAALLPSVLFGVATVGAVYALGQRLGGRPMGLGAAAIVAALPFHVEMSRRAMLDAGYVFFLVLTMYFCVAWLQDARRRQAVGVGCAAGGAALAKLPGVLAMPAILLVLLLGLALALRRGRSEAKEVLLQGGLGAAPVAAGGLLYLGLLAHLSALENLRMKLEWQFGRIDTSRAQVRELAAIEREPLWYFTDPEFGMQEQLMPVGFALALVGLGVVLLRLAFPGRRAEHAVLPVFALVLLGFFMYSDRKEGFYLLPFVPIAAILVAYAGDGLRRMLLWAGLRFRPRSAAPVGTAAAVLGIVLVAAPAYAAASESVDDFVRGDDQEKYFGYGTREAAAWIAEHDPAAGQYGTLLGRWSLHWYNEQDTYHWYVDHTYVENQVRAGELRYVVYEDYLGLAFDREFMRDLIDRNGGVAVESFRSGWGEVTVFELQASASST